MYSQLTQRRATDLLRQPKVVLWALVGIFALGFMIAVEIMSRHYGEPGPLTNQVREIIFTPKSGPLLYAGLGLMLITVSWRDRFYSLGAALAIDVVFALVRLVVDAKQNFGNGALWVLLGWAAYAAFRCTGRRRTLLLKGVGLGLLLVAGRKVGDSWLLITTMSRPRVLDQFVAAADHALGDPSWLMGRAVRATGSVGAHVLDYVYVQLAVAAVLVALYQLRNVARLRRFPSHHLVRTFLVIGLLGPAVYMLFPVVGPIFAYGVDGGHYAVANLWPNTVPPVVSPHWMDFDKLTPRNCMPSLHTAWATAIFIHSRKAPRLLRYAGTFWLLATLTATLGFGYHYGTDLVAGAVFCLTIEAALRSPEQGWGRTRIQLVGYGTAVFAALLLMYRYASIEMADDPWLYGPLVIFGLISMIWLYIRTTRAWESTEAPDEISPDRRVEPAVALPR
ncbi:phosphatase PAP2 family protein [Jongsikchunia kroppenstedtii]|uniref:phosphatase PAP2 family protein n=1 Tax=Jongsikchunia kroppenstedtii TaxID=1121721 RepID=UPI000382C047|nr:phosphatase PAP2 family protein [Jongsikchunia kroppenstedtii]